MSNLLKGSSWILLTAVLPITCLLIGCPPPVELLTEGEPCGIAVDNGYVYWTEGCASEAEPPDGQIWKIPIDGSAPKASIATDRDRPAKIVAHNDVVYWTEWGTDRVQKMSTTGGTISEIGKEVGYSHARPIVRDDYLYWSDGYNVKRVHIPSGIISQENVTSHPFPPDPHYDVRDFTWDGLYVYYSRWLEGMVLKRPIGGPTTVLASLLLPSHPAAIDTDGSHVYWGDHLDVSGAIKRTTISGGPIDTIYTGVQNVYDLAVDDIHVYWTETGGVRRIVKSGGAVENIAGLSSAASDISLTDDMIFWGEHGKGIFMREK